MPELKLNPLPSAAPATSGNLRLGRANSSSIYDTWKADPSPENGALLFRELAPAIESATKRHAGDASPVNLGRAKSILIDALPRYDGRASLSTFVDRQLQPMKRWAAQRRVGVKMPTSVATQAYLVGQVEQELEDQLGRAPSRAEVADAAGIPITRLRRIAGTNVPIVAERQLANDGEGYAEAGDQAIEDDQQLAMQMTYYSLNPVNQFIMERTMGLYGQKPLSNQEIARRLKISPGAVSQRKATIQRLIDQS